MYLAPSTLVAGPALTLRAITRRRVIAAMFAAGLVSTVPQLGGIPPRVAASSGTPTARRPPPLSQRGINYDVGTEWQFGDSRLVWNDELMRHEIDAIRDDLHCNAVLVHGTDTGRLIQTATHALERGLIVWVQPRLMNAQQSTVVANLSEVAAAVETLRVAYPTVGLNVGVEFGLFTSDIIPGVSLESRVDYLIDNLSELPRFDERLDVFLSRCEAAVSAHFEGATTYSSGEWETVDWSRFDFAGIDLYRDRYNVDWFADPLRALAASGKPVIVTEFGCCTFVGAEDYGGSGWEVVDYTTDPPTFKEPLVRSETTQADEVLALLDIFEAEGVHGAFVYQLIDQGMTHSDDPSLDLDKANFGIVKTFAEGMGKPTDPSYWEPKEAFLRIAERFAPLA